MSEQPARSILERLKVLVLGRGRSLRDRSIFHKLSLIAFFAWIGLGADGLSSSCYGPSEAFKNLGEHVHLGIFVALATAVTIFVISASYSQIIELFPTGGGGYLVGSKLLSPSVGMVSGCALLVDYVLTIALSVSSGVDALLSFFPPEILGLKVLSLKVPLALAAVLVLTLMNLRGVKESVLPLVPIFAIFIITHAVAILYAAGAHLWTFSAVAASTVADVRQTASGLGLAGMFMLIMHSYGMGAGTFTGIEAVSNGLPNLREPRVETGRRTMRYMAVSLAVTVVGLMLAYLLYHVGEVEGKTLNAVLFESITATWPGRLGSGFVIVALFSEAALLLVAAQTGFLDGPRVLANMARDRWFPGWLSVLSDRLVIRNGILIMGVASVVTIVLAGGSVDYLVVVYSINVFITFTLSQAGMVRHWWSSRNAVRNWRRKLLINGVGLVLCVFILVLVTGTKFMEGGWVTLVVTGTLIMVAVLIQRHYRMAQRLIQRWNLVAITRILWDKRMPIALPDEPPPEGAPKPRVIPCDPQAKTAVLLVNGYNGLGLQMVADILTLFPGVFKNFIFVTVGVIDAGNFKGAAAVGQLQQHVWSEVDRYIVLMRDHGFAADGCTAVGTDVVDEIAQLAPDLLQKFPQSVLFVGQLILPRDSLATRWLHNNIAFALQRRLSSLAVPFVSLPVRVATAG